MRILKLRFANLNSLVGEWLIDFTHHAYTDDGIFAIIGPTGAGKSTLLDALSIALFGRTCRMGGLSKSANEVMSRRTGECFAEVWFETPSGQYLCRWEQRRARARADGELQQPRQRIADAEGTILTSKIREVAETVERLTGLDFDRFTRSVLLAQGDFSAFLNADADDRAPLLERITGSEIYSRISIHVHERQLGLRRDLELLTAEMGADPILDAARVEELKQRCDQGEGEVKRLAERLALLRRIEERRGQASALGRKRETLQVRQAELARDGEEMGEVQRRLERDHRAQGLAEEWRALRQSRDDGDEAGRQAREIADEITAAQAAREQAQVEVGRADEARRAASQRAEAGKEKIALARALDVRLEEKREQVAGDEEALGRQQRELEERRRRIAELREELAGLHRQTRESEVYLERHAEDAQLGESLAGIRERLEQLAKEEARHQGLQGTLARRRDALEAGRQRLAQAERERQAFDARQEQAEQRHQAVRRRIAELGDARALEGLARRRDELARRQLLLDKAHHGLEWCDKARARIAALEASLQAARHRQPKLEEASRMAQREVEHWRARSEQLRKLVVLMRKVASLEEERRFLVSGEPCPLCGARDHPYAEETPASHPDEQGLGEAEAALDEANRKAADAQREQQGLNDEITALGRRMAEEEQAHDEERGRVSELLRQAEWGSDAASVEALRGGLAELLEERDRIAETLERLDQLRAEEERQRMALEQAREAAHDAGLACREATYARDGLEAEVRRLDDEAAQAGQGIAARSQALAAELSRFAVDPGALADPVRMRQALEARATAWRSRQQALSALRERAAISGGNLAPLEADQPRLEREYTEGRARLDEAREGVEALRQERRGLLGDEQADVAEARLDQALSKAEAGWREARERLKGIEANRESLERHRQRIDARIEALAAELARRQQAWLASLKQADFDAEAGFTAALLDPAERKALQDRLADHREQRRVLEERLRSVADEQAEVQRELPLLERQAESLPGEEREMTAVEARIAEVQRELGALQRTLEEDRDARAREQGRLARRQALDGELARWGALHELIGSADGKKYRNFAQGITFEVMVGYANQALARMSDRYLLVCDDQRPLELMVMDGYQAGEVRSTRNLSGGESFIVSLALALGLSEMVSAGWRIDSLFIDEGFGTLDEHALEAALEALAGLRRSGKLVGVISHVPALRERIAARIRVRPLSGGRSRIEGPGCSAVTRKAPLAVGEGQCH